MLALWDSNVFNIVALIKADKRVVETKASGTLTIENITGYSHREVVEEALPAGGTLQEVVNLTLEGRFSSTPMLLHVVTTLPRVTIATSGGTQQ